MATRKQSSAVLNKENIMDSIGALSEKANLSKRKAISDAETNWQISANKEHSLDCSQPGCDVGGIDKLTKDLEEILSSVDGENSLANILHKNEAERVILEKQLSETQQIATEMQQISGLGREMEAVDVALHENDFSEAVAGILSLEDRLTGLRQAGFSTDTGELYKVVDLVETQLRLRRSSLCSCLMGIWRAAILIDNDDSGFKRLVVSDRIEGRVAGQKIEKPLSLEQVWRCLEQLGCHDLVLECCDYLSRNLLLAMVSNEISNIRSAEHQNSSLVVDSFTDATGHKTVLSLTTASIHVNKESESMDPPVASIDENSHKQAIRIPLRVKEEDLSATPLSKFLVFLRDIADTLEFISEKVFHGAASSVYLFLFLSFFKF